VYNADMGQVVCKPRLEDKMTLKLKLKPILEAMADHVQLNADGEFVPFDPLSKIIEIASGNMVCGVCHGDKEAKYALTDEDGNRLKDEAGNIKTAFRLCQSCYGTGKEALSPKIVLDANEMLLAKMYPDLKAIEHTGDVGNGLAEAILERRRLREAMREQEDKTITVPPAHEQVQ
jgi:hypothetical protein